MKSLIKSTQQIERIKKASKLVCLTLNELEKHLKIGISLNELDQIAKTFILKNGGKPAFLGYNNFPATLCTSVNNVLVHGIPNYYKLKDGDLVTIDVGAIVKGYYGDSARTYVLGENLEAKKLVADTKQCLDEVIKTIIPFKTTIGDLGNFVEKFATSHGYSVPKDYAGHGIGKKLHEDPLVLNYGEKNKGMVLVPGMTICIEPMFIIGEDDLFVDPIDNWTVRTKHGGLTSHEEHTILITDKSFEILSKI